MAEMRSSRRTDEFIVAAVDSHVSGVGYFSPETGIYSFIVKTGQDDIANHGVLAIERARIEEKPVKFLFNRVKIEVQVKGEDITLCVSNGNEDLANIMREQLFQLHQIVTTVIVQQ